MTDRAQASVHMTHAVGLHARPSVKLTKLAKTFQSDIVVRAGEGAPPVDAKSIVKVMAMKAPAETTLVFEATGVDARTAVDALVDLVASDFEAETAHAGKD